jgi:predicted NBD/HSP70 family sugar kinase
MEERLFTQWPNLLVSEGLVGGIDVSSLGIRYMLCDLDGHVLARGRTDRSLASPQEAIAELWSQLAHHIRSLHRSEDALVRLGVSFSGVIHPKSGRVLWSPALPTWEGYELKGSLEDFAAAIVVANNANAGAVGEVLFGAAADARHVAYLHLGQGVGLGIFCEGKLYAGARGFAGEVGHMRMPGLDSPCRCGGRGHLEVCAPPFLYRDTALEREPITDAINSAIDAALQGIQPYRDRLSVFTESFVAALHQIWLLLDPEVIVVGSSSGKLNSYLAREASAQKDAWPFDRTGEWRHVKPASRPGDSELCGALGLALLSLTGD